jgi:uncharacterized protein YbjT (DUF2867 family)
VDIAIVGAHGKVARRLARLLVARGDPVRGLIRNPDHAHDLRDDGVEPVLCDTERAGAGSGPERRWTIDRDGAIKLIEAARGDAIDRYVMISSIGAENPPSDDDVFSVFLRAKAEADRALMDSGLEWTIVRPVWLSDDPGSMNGDVRRPERRPEVGAVRTDPVLGWRSIALGAAPSAPPPITRSASGICRPGFVSAFTYLHVLIVAGA